jgi:3-oxoacyl-(acyl-carrier-protein) synthase
VKTGIAVTGMGIISSIGKNTREFGDALRAGECGIGCLEKGPNPPIAGNIGAEIKGFSLESLVRQYENYGLPADFVRNLMICSYDAPPSAGNCGRR